MPYRVVSIPAARYVELIGVRFRGVLCLNWGFRLRKEQLLFQDKNEALRLMELVRHFDIVFARVSHVSRDSLSLSPPPLPLPLTATTHTHTCRRYALLNVHIYRALYPCSQSNVVPDSGLQALDQREAAVGVIIADTARQLYALAAGVEFTEPPMAS